MEWVFNDNECQPLHCPFDRIIAIDILKQKDFTWTDFDGNEEECKKKYKELVKAARGKAELLSIAEWELIVYDEYMKKD